MDKSTIFSMLDFLCSELSKKREGLVFSATTEDGRVDSSLEEELVKNEIKDIFSKNLEELDGWKLNTTNIVRHWFDISISHSKESNVFIPINIKCSKCESADNLSSKEGVLFAIGGGMVNLERSSAWEAYSFKLAKVLKDLVVSSEDTSLFDYYYIVLDKKYNTFFSSSLKSISVLTPNGSNLPFQCNWGLNRTRCVKEEIESVRYIVHSFYESLSKRAEAFISFKEIVMPSLTYFCENYKGSKKV